MIAQKIGTISPPERRRAACAGWAAPRRRAALTCQRCWRPRARPGMAPEGVPPQRGWARWRSDACPVLAPEGLPGDSVPTTTAAGCVPGDGARRPSRRWPVQAMDACPVTALGCPIRARWRSGCSNHRAESGANRSSHGLLVPAQRLAHQRRRTCRSGERLGDTSFQKSPDLVGAKRRPLHARVGRQLGFSTGVL
jgi:hypothetical protein